MKEIKLHEASVSPAHIVGFCFPVYAFGIPRICRKYLEKLAVFQEQQKVFILITAGSKDESGYAIKECISILKRKNCKIIYTAVVEMPPNWTVSMNPPNKAEALEIISRGVEQTKAIANDIVNGIETFHAFNVPKTYGTFSFYKDYILFKYLGVSNLWRNFRVDEDCNGCGICAKICPTASIQMTNNAPGWHSSCEQCMRCVNFCPKKAIYQSHEGSIKEKNTYHEPDFKPLQTLPS